MAFLSRCLVLAAACAASATWAVSDPAPKAAAGGSAEALKARYAALRGDLEHNGFGRPLVLKSNEEGRDQRGEVYAIVNYPFDTVENGLGAAQSWCDVLILPYNTKHCHANGGGDSAQLAVRIGRKSDQAPQDASLITFTYRVQARAADYLRVVLDSPDGPLGTRDYRIVFEATPLDGRRTFIRLGYSYGFGTMARLAMQAYLGTAGAHKVGFTVTGTDARGNPVYVKGMLGATERNTMRYFLAVDAYLGSLAVPETQRLEKRLNDWYAASGSYPLQLSEMDKGEYLAMKRREAQLSRRAL